MIIISYEDAMNRVGQVENRINSAFGTIESLAALDARLVIAEAEIAAIETEIGEPFPTSRLDSLETDVTTVETDLGTLESNVTTLETTLKGVGKIGSTEQFNNANERTTRSLTYVKVKETTVYRFVKEARVTWEMFMIGVLTATAKVYVNDIAVGVEKTTAADAYELQTDDLTLNLEPGDKIQIYGFAEIDSEDLKIRNFKILMDEFTSDDP